MAGLFKEFVKTPIIHGSKLWSNAVYREYYWLRTKFDKFPAHKQAEIKINKLLLTVPDVPSFLNSFKEIFIDEIYEFSTDAAKPVIIDMGGNIGLSSIFFRRRHPNARILAYEADKKIFEFMTNNITANGYENIETFNYAVWNENGSVTFKPDNADGGHISNNGLGITVPAIKFKDVLKDFDKIDILKIDIEGAENAIFDQLAEEVTKVDNLFIEYHSFCNSQQKLGRLLSILEENKFLYNIENPHQGGMPAISHEHKDYPALRINVWAKNLEFNK